MEITRPSSILKDVKMLVAHSCSDLSAKETSFLSLHKGIIKVYFEARNVEINYETQEIKVEIPLTQKNFTSVNFICQDLERFLKSCIRSDNKSLMYYQTILSHYSFLKFAS